MKNTEEFILCAAIWYNDNIPHKENACPNVKTGVVIAGHRHYNCISLMPTGKDFLKDFPERNLLKMDNFESTQGFMTSKGRFVDRQEGMKIAFIAGQVSMNVAIITRNDDKDFWECVETRMCINDGEETFSAGMRKCIADAVIEWKKLYSEDLY